MDQPVAPPWLESLSEEFQSRYGFRRLLGAGVTSCVYLARQYSLDRNVVVKLLRTEFEPDSDVAERFRREAGVLAGMHHDRVVTLLDFGSDGDILYMVYPDVGGQALEGWCRGRLPLEPRDAIPLLADVLEGLSVIHEMGVVHRDLKPANVLVAEDGRVVLIDFGLAKNLAGHRTLTGTGHIVGTPNYMAPGQVLGEPASAGDDLYAVGVIAYEMLVGSNPFSAHDLTQTLQNHLTLRPDSPARFRPDIPADFAEWVLDLLEKAEADRIPSADAARERLVALEGVKTLPGVWIPKRGDDGPSRTQLMRRWIAKRASEKKRSGRGLGVALGVFVAATMLGVMLPGGEAPPPASSARAPSPTGPVVPDAASRGPPLPTGLVEAIEGELVALFERRVDAQGRLTNDPSAPRSISPDPAKWGEVFSRLHSLGRFHDWLAAGGLPEDLDPVTQQRMERVDGVFRDLGFPPPFLPYRKARPSGVPVPRQVLRLEGGREYQEDLDAHAWQGWGGAFRRAVADAEARRIERETLFIASVESENWGRLPEGFSRYLQLEALVRPAAAKNHRQLSRLLAFYDTTEVARHEYVRWVDPDQERVRTMLWTAARAVRDEPEVAEPVAYMLPFWADQFRTLLRGPLAHASPRFGLGFVPTGPLGAHLEATVRSVEARGGDFPSLSGVEAEAWTRAAVPSGSSMWANRRLVSAMYRGADAYSHTLDVDGWERHVRRSLGLLHLLGAGLRQDAFDHLLWSAQAWAKRIDSQLAPRLGAALGRLHPELVALSPESDPTVRRLQETLVE